jgi:hypothetical protein
MCSHEICAHLSRAAHVGGLELKLPREALWHADQIGIAIWPVRCYYATDVIFRVGYETYSTVEHGGLCRAQDDAHPGRSIYRCIRALQNKTSSSPRVSEGAFCGILMLAQRARLVLRTCAKTQYVRLGSAGFGLGSGEH